MNHPEQVKAGMTWERRTWAAGYTSFEAASTRRMKSAKHWMLSTLAGTSIESDGAGGGSQNEPFELLMSCRLAGSNSLLELHGP